MLKAKRIFQNGSNKPELSGRFRPTKMGDYEIVRLLGQGGMGTVYLANHEKLGRQVALKVLAHHRLLDQCMQERFGLEMRAIGALSHPNIVTAFDAREIEGTTVLVTEYIDGLDLGKVVNRLGKLSIPDACQVASVIARALAYTDERGFVHRDIKPSNIMLSSKGMIKVLDLGLARIAFVGSNRLELTVTGQAMGSPDYVAPEQINDGRAVDGPFKEVVSTELPFSLLDHDPRTGQALGVLGEIGSEGDRELVLFDGLMDGNLRELFRQRLPFQRGQRLDVSQAKIVALNQVIVVMNSIVYGWDLSDGSQLYQTDPRRPIPSRVSFSPDRTLRQTECALWEDSITYVERQSGLRLRTLAMPHDKLKSALKSIPNVEDMLLTGPGTKTRLELKLPDPLPKDVDPGMLRSKMMEIIQKSDWEIVDDAKLKLVVQIAAGKPLTTQYISYSKPEGNA